MQYLIPSILTIISYVLGTYFAFQELRNPIEKSLAYRSESTIFFLTILFGWMPIAVALYLSYVNTNSFFLAILVVVRFIILPTILNDRIKKFMDEKGI